MTDRIQNEALRNDPLTPHLLDILSRVEFGDVILAGGFGLRVKQAYIREQIEAGRTLIKFVPLTRATQDLDLFLSLELWTKPEKGRSVRGMLDDLGYSVIPAHQNLQFAKDFDETTGMFRVKVDLMARPPEGEEQKQVKFDARRVGKDSSKEGSSTVGLHGRTTPEAFAISDTPKQIEIVGSRADGQEVLSRALVPHPYAFLNMKIKAAHDWLRTIRGEAKPKPSAEKHVFDVYAIVAMFLPDEIEECKILAASYAGHPIAQECKQNAMELFAMKDGSAFTEVIRQLGDLPYDYETFWEGLQLAMGIIS